MLADPGPPGLRMHHPCRPRGSLKHSEPRGHLSEGAYKETQPSPAFSGQGQPWQSTGTSVEEERQRVCRGTRRPLGGRIKQGLQARHLGSPPHLLQRPHLPSVWAPTGPLHICQEDGQGSTTHPVQPLPSLGGWPCHQQPSFCHLLREAPGGGRGAAGRAPCRRADSF